MREDRTKLPEGWSARQTSWTGWWTLFTPVGHPQREKFRHHVQAIAAAWAVIDAERAAKGDTK